MGTSETIKDKEKSNDEFRKFMDQLGKESRAEEDRLLQALTKTAKEMYENNGWDYSRLFGDKRSDYQNYANWSLERITNIIDQIGGALQAGVFPSKVIPGSEDATKEAEKDFKEYLPGFQNDYSLTIARVTALITGILSQFSVASEAKQNSVQTDLYLGGGQHLFLGSTGSVFKRDTFFTNQFIGSFQIVFVTYISVDEAKAYSLSEILKATAQQIEIESKEIVFMRQTSAEILREIFKKNIQDYKTAKKTFEEAIQLSQATLDMLLAQYNQYKNVVEIVDQFFPNLDLTEFGVNSIRTEGLKVEHLFTEKEAVIARRYISERLTTSAMSAHTGLK